MNHSTRTKNKRKRTKKIRTMRRGGDLMDDISAQIDSADMDKINLLFKKIHELDFRLDETLISLIQKKGTLQMARFNLVRDAAHFIDNPDAGNVASLAQKQTFLEDIPHLGNEIAALTQQIAQRLQQLDARKDIIYNKILKRMDELKRQEEDDVGEKRDRPVETDPPFNPELEARARTPAEIAEDALREKESQDPEKPTSKRKK